jgi:hypothetical protein
MKVAVHYDFGSLVLPGHLYKLCNDHAKLLLDPLFNPVGERCWWLHEVFFPRIELWPLAHGRLILRISQRLIGGEGIVPIQERQIVFVRQVFTCSRFASARRTGNEEDIAQIMFL